MLLISKKYFRLIFAPLVGVLLAASIFFYLKFQESNPDFMLSQAEKKQLDHKEFFEYYGETEPEFPDNIFNSKTIIGIDNNHNGIRDDIDVWINRSAYDFNENKAMRQFARDSQKLLLLCESENSRDIIQADIEQKKSEICLKKMSDYKRKFENYAYNKLKIILFNTEDRKRCIKSLNDQMDQNKYSSLTNSSNFFCNFEIQYYQNVIFGNNDWMKK